MPMDFLIQYLYSFKTATEKSVAVDLYLILKL